METDDWLWPHLKPKGEDYSVRYKFRPLQLFAGPCWRYSLINLITINYSISYIWLQYIHCMLVSQNLGWGEHMSCSPKEPQARRIVFLAVCFGVFCFFLSVGVVRTCSKRSPVLLWLNVLLIRVLAWGKRRTHRASAPTRLLCTINRSRFKAG